MTTADASAGDGVPSPADRVRRTVLPNGLRVVTDEQPERASASVSVWVAVGARDEPDELAGASHFLEHLLFKGTAERNAKQLAMDIDGVGGEMNAFTAAEHTAFYTAVPADHVEMATDLLLDVVDRPLLDPDDVEAERRVILEELAAAEEDPDDLASVRLFESLFPGHPLGRETLGSVESIGALTRDDIAGFFTEWYQPPNLVVAAAGAVDHDKLVAAVQERFGSRTRGGEPVRSAPKDGIGADVSESRPVELAHVALGWRAPGIHSPDRFALAVLNHLFGGSPSSHLFQEIRESRGLTYSVGSEVTQHADAGALSVYSATASEHAEQLVGLVDRIAADLAASRIEEAEVTRAKGALRGGLVMAFEHASSRMTRLAVGETMRGEVLSVQEHLDRIEAVTLDDVRRIGAEVFGRPRVLSLVGPDGWR